MAPANVSHLHLCPISHAFTGCSECEALKDCLPDTACVIESQSLTLCRMSDELQPRQAAALLDAQDKNGALTASEESLTSKELQEIGSFNSAGSVDKKDMNLMGTRARQQGLL